MITYGLQISVAGAILASVIGFQQADAQIVSVHFKVRSLARDTVYAPDLGNKISGAVISLDSANYVKVSDANGEGIFVNFPKGSHTLRLSHPDYKTFLQTFTFTQDTTIWLATPATIQKGVGWIFSDFWWIYAYLTRNSDGPRWAQINPVNTTMSGASNTDSIAIKLQVALMETLSEYKLYNFVSNVSPDTTYTIFMNSGTGTSILSYTADRITIKGWSQIGHADSTTISHEIIKAYGGWPTDILSSNSYSGTQERIRFQPKDGIMLKVTLDQHHRRQNKQQDLWLGNMIADYAAPALPATSAILSPANKSINQDTALAFTLRPDTNAIRYELQITKDTTGTPVVADSILDRTSTTKLLNLNITYFARSRAIGALGVGPWSSWTGFSTKRTTDIGRVDAVPTQYALQQNYPNPFNPSTRIAYSLVNSGFVRLKVYDVLGREIETLVDAFQEAGWHSVSFNGMQHASGIYIYELSCGGKRFQKTMLLIK